MPWLIYVLASGETFFWGAVVLVLAVVVRSKRKTRIVRLLSLSLAIFAIALIAVSGAALPIWAYVLWTMAILVWLVWPQTASYRRTGVVEIALLLLTVAAVFAELRYEIRPTLPAGHYSRLYVIGDSISAGLRGDNSNTWPSLLRNEMNIDVIDLSFPGYTIAQAARRIRSTPLSDGLVLIEIGGNDWMNRAAPAQFGKALDELISLLESPSRQLVMLELPLLPFDNAYGLEQRRVAGRHHLTLIPKRFFLDVLRVPGATVDDIHLSESGQRTMAEMVWNFIGDSVASRGKK